MIPCAKLSTTTWEILIGQQDRDDDVGRSMDKLASVINNYINPPSQRLSSVNLVKAISSPSEALSIKDTKAPQYISNPLVVRPHEPERVLLDEYSDKYELLSTIGKGGFGVVYKGMQLDTQTLVAFKCVPLRDKFTLQGKTDLRELFILKSVQECSNIVHLLDHFQLESQLVLVMELAQDNLVDMLHRYVYDGQRTYDVRFC